jgi:nitrogen regulatory protein P-II 1
MNSMIWFVLHDAELLSDVLTAWKETGILGITILPSTGLHRLEGCNSLREDIPLIPSIEDLLSDEETLNRTLFTIVDNDTLVEKVIDATQRVVGDLNTPNTGILCVIPLGKVFGLNRKMESKE